MICFLFVIVAAFCTCRSYTLKKFTAAVYEHVPIRPGSSMSPVTTEEAFANMNKNIDVLEKAVKSAARQGAHIIVTPEYAICCLGLTRETVYPYLEDIPSPEVNWVPCSDPKRFGSTPVQERLSCMAKKNSIYLVANIGDKKVCNISNDGCPEDGHYIYDTTIVFDLEGKLIARYHKYHLFFGESQFNRPKEPEIVTFNTPFGKFCIFICYDILFHDPAVALVTQHNVDTVIFTTAWFNTLPHYSSIEFHSSWAMGMGVNLLSSNIHNSSLKMTGSGIFSPDNLGPYYYNKDTDEGQLVISQLSSHPRNCNTHPPIKWDLYASKIRRFPPGSNVFNKTIFIDEFTVTEINNPQGNYTVCHNNLCCHLSYKMLKKQSDEVYILGAYDGFHGPRKVFYVEVCTLLKCKNVDNCTGDEETSSTKFESFSLSGTFASSHVFPEVLLSEVTLAPGMFKVLKDGRLVSLPNISSKPLLSVSLLGRNYKRDPEGINVSLLTRKSKQN
ncbi:pantetheinase [Bombina bombina]|uniref:pantetheinase n=1 Tax=Bombina bombina TaxID=8345 RepID=UPI00235AF8E0|nr:pantetheinase [Bombina bombina]